MMQSLGQTPLLNVHTGPSMLTAYQLNTVAPRENLFQEWFTKKTFGVRLNLPRTVMRYLPQDEVDLLLFTPP